ncbi:putative mobilization protein B [Bacteroides fragilis str. 3976T8]|uniref:Putative mobilization protein B n=2 Tax=Bacteroides fragilis TaxID=817 RepID=A0A016ATY5_BACFG|nr:putative mobilization protein B [Bacteroides fragilis str. 3976T8]
MEHEDLERMEKGIYAEGFFNLTDDNIYKSKVIKDIDSNIGQLLKTDAKFYAIHISPSEKELRVMGNTEQEQAEAMKRYIREVFIPEYAKNFNKELTASDIKFYGKIHFNRNRSNNKLNMHCHLIASRKDQSNKKKLSPLTNHKNTKSGIIKGGFDRVNLFQQVEQGFDKLLGYNRQQKESFDYHNTIRNSAISEQKKLQEQEFQFNERKIIINQNSNQENALSINHGNKEIDSLSFNTDRESDKQITTPQLNNQQSNIFAYSPPLLSRQQQTFCQTQIFLKNKYLINLKKKEGRTQAII